MRSVVVIPTYQNLSTLPTILDECIRANQPVIVVDDGSTDGTAEWLDAWCRQGENRWKITQKMNRGKGAALALGLAEAVQRTFECAMTVDADGQHRIEDALELLSRWMPGRLLVGSRDETAIGYPITSLFGRRLWALGIRAVTGLGISDPVCGLRVYPLAEISTIRCRSGRYAWEEEFLIRAAQLGVIMDQQRIATVYLPRGRRVSQYNLARDWGESLLVFIVMSVQCLLRFAPIRIQNQPLRCRDRSSRRLLGMAVFVGGVCGLISPIWVVAPILAWIAWKLHASWPMAVGSAVAVAVLSGNTSPWILVAGSALAAIAITQAARILGNN